jgi:hypothetical protein
MPLPVAAAPGRPAVPDRRAVATSRAELAPSIIARRAGCFPAAPEHPRRAGAMTPLGRLCVKTSFVFLMVGRVLRGYIVIQVNLMGSGCCGRLIMAHVHVVR